MTPEPEMLDAQGRQLPANACPTCGYVMDSATCTTDEAGRPSEGDYSACMKCGELFVFTATLNLRILDLNDMLEMRNETQAQLLKVQAVIRRERVKG